MTLVTRRPVQFAKIAAVDPMGPASIRLERPRSWACVTPSRAGDHVPLESSDGSHRATRYERSLILVLFLTWGAVFLDRMSQLYLAPFFAPEFHLSNEQVGVLASVVAIA